MCVCLLVSEREYVYLCSVGGGMCECASVCECV